MNQKYSLVFFFLLVSAFASKAQYKPVSVSGFNADIIANGVGDASFSTTAAADAGPYAFVAEDFMAASGGTSPTYFLPNSRIINSASTAGLSFRLADYSLNNAVRLESITTTTETLILDTAQTAAQVYLLAYSGSNASTGDFTLNFSDGSQQMASASISDWFDGTPFVVQGIGRIKISDNSFSGNALNPRLYAVKIPVDYANYGKTIASITISKTNSTPSVLGVLAVSILNFDPAFQAMTVTGFNADVIADGTGDPAFSTTNDVDGATPPYVFVSADYQYDANCAFPARALPVSGFLASDLVPGMAYQLAPYSGNNDLRLAGTDAGTLTFANPMASKNVFLLGVGGNGSARISATVTFTDNTTEFFDNIDIGDWYGGTNNIVTSGIGRLNRTTTSCSGLETSTASPKLFQLPLTLSTGNYSKPVSSVTITRIDGVTNITGIANILAVTVEMSGALLPVRVASFKGYALEGGNKLEWTTKTEVNNKGFELQKSIDGNQFTGIAFISTKANEGNSTREIKYSYVDSKARTTVNNYYRLKPVDRDGKVLYSNVALIKSQPGKSLELISLYPNPANDRLTISLASPVSENVTVIVSDATGKTVLQKSVSASAGANNVNLDIHGLHSGSYILKVSCSSGCVLSNSKFIKL